MTDIKIKTNNYLTTRKTNYINLDSFKNDNDNLSYSNLKNESFVFSVKSSNNLSRNDIPLKSSDGNLWDLEVEGASMGKSLNKNMDSQYFNNKLSSPKCLSPSNSTSQFNDHPL